MKTARRNYSVLVLLAFVFAAPGIAAYFFYAHPQWLGEAFTNKGDLLDPPVLLTHLDPTKTYATLAGKSQTTGPIGISAKSQWQLILWSPQACEKRCLQQLDKLARIRLALGRRLYEVRPLLLLGDQAPDLAEGMREALLEQDIQVKQLPVGVRAGMPTLKNHLGVFIANPDNYLVLAYLPSAKPGDIFHDIKHLLSTTDKMSK